MSGPAGERRSEVRFPTVGIGLLYSPAERRPLAEPGREFLEAFAADMSLWGLAFDVLAPLEEGQVLWVLVERPTGGVAERLETVVRWRRRLLAGRYRVGTSICCAQVLPGRSDEEQARPDPVGTGLEYPSEVQLLCPACHQLTVLQLCGVQGLPVLEGGNGRAGAVPIYDCSGCRSTRAITSVLRYNRQACAQRNEP